MNNQTIKSTSVNNEYLQLQHLRQVALTSAERLNPVQTFINSQLGGPNDGKRKPTIEQVLRDADKIYEWLVNPNK